MSKEAAKKCYLCPAPATTRDHVPPKCIFPDPLPANLITVPCCYSCNNGFSKDDEFLRFLASTPINIADSGQEGLYKFLTRTLPKRRIKDQLATVKPLGEKTISTPAGPIRGMEVAYPTKHINSVMIRITKGLLAVLYPQVDYLNFEYEVRSINQFVSSRVGEVSAKQGAVPHFMERGNRAFQVWHAVFERNGYGGWFYSFHNALGFNVMHRNRTGQIRRNANVPFAGPTFESGAAIVPRKI